MNAKKTTGAWLFILKKLVGLSHLLFFLWSLPSIYREDYSVVWLINMLCPLWVCVVAATLSVHLV